MQMANISHYCRHEYNESHRITLWFANDMQTWIILYKTHFEFQIPLLETVEKNVLHVCNRK